MIKGWHSGQYRCLLGCSGRQDGPDHIPTWRCIADGVCYTLFLSQVVPTCWCSCVWLRHTSSTQLQNRCHRPSSALTMCAGGLTPVSAAGCCWSADAGGRKPPVHPQFVVCPTQRLIARCWVHVLMWCYSIVTPTLAAPPWGIPMASPQRLCQSCPTANAHVCLLVRLGVCNEGACSKRPRVC